MSSKSKDLKKTLPKSDSSKAGRVKHQIGFVIGLLVLKGMLIIPHSNAPTIEAFTENIFLLIYFEKGLPESANGTTMQISWKEEGSRYD